MAMRKLGPEAIARAQQLRSSGWTLTQVAQELGVSVETARKACAMPTGQPPPAEPPPSTRPTGDPPPEPPDDAGTAGMTPVEILDTLAARLSTALTGEIDTNAQLSIARLAKDIALARAKLTPPAPPKHELNPDMIAARDAVRARVREALDREAVRRDEAPKCPGCGQPVMPQGEVSPVQLLIQWVFG